MKKLMLALAAGLIVTTTPASAEPITITGDAAIKYQRDSADGEAATSGSVFTIKLKGEADLGDGWSLYTRLAAQRVSDSGLADFNVSPSVYGEDKKWVVALDQFGVNYKTEKLNYKLGRQDITVGTTALLYSRPDSNVGKKAFVDGLSVTGTIGAMDIAAVAAREDNPDDESENKLYAIRAGYSPVEAFNYGVTLGRYSSDDSTNHWAIDGIYKMGKSHITAEYTKSSSNSKNAAFAVGVGYDFDDKVSAAITGFRVEEFGSMGQQSDFDYDNRGVHYTLGYALNDAASLEFVYKDQKTISEGKNNKSFEATLSYAF